MTFASMCILSRIQRPFILWQNLTDACSLPAIEPICQTNSPTWNQVTGWPDNGLWPSVTTQQPETETIQTILLLKFDLSDDQWNLKCHHIANHPLVELTTNCFCWTQKQFQAIFQQEIREFQPPSYSDLSNPFLPCLRIHAISTAPTAFHYPLSPFHEQILLAILLAST